MKRQSKFNKNAEKSTGKQVTVLIFIANTPKVLLPGMSGTAPQ